jgi:hypothetical protein
MGDDSKMDLNKKKKKNTIQFLVQHINKDRILLLLYSFYKEII